MYDRARFKREFVQTLANYFGAYIYDIPYRRPSREDADLFDLLEEAAPKYAKYDTGKQIGRDFLGKHLGGGAEAEVFMHPSDSKRVVRVATLFEEYVGCFELFRRMCYEAKSPHLPRMYADARIRITYDGPYFAYDVTIMDLVKPLPKTKVRGLDDEQQLAYVFLTSWTALRRASSVEVTKKAISQSAWSELADILGHSSGRAKIKMDKDMLWDGLFRHMKKCKLPICKVVELLVKQTKNYGCEADTAAYNLMLSSSGNDLVIIDAFI